MVYLLTYLPDGAHRPRRLIDPPGSAGLRVYECVCVTFVTLECVRARVWLLPSLRSVGACVWPWLPERVVVVHIVLNYLLTHSLSQPVAGRNALILLPSPFGE